MDLSVIIVNYNVRRFLENALTSIERAMEGIQGEIFVVDNCSDDGSVEMVRAQFPGVTLIENKVNAGFARANNMALRRAQGDFLLLINPDTIVQEDTFHVMLEFFKQTPDAGLAGCKILNPDGSFQLPCRRSFPTPWVAFTKTFGLSSIFPRSRWFGKYNLTYLSEDESYEVDAVSGSFMMLRRATYEKIGGLDEAFFMYGEDLDWCYRVSHAGYRVYYVHSTKIIHFKGESTRRSDIDEIRHFYQAMHLFVEKHFSGSIFFEMILSLGIFLRATLAFAAKYGRIAFLVIIDFLLVDVALELGELIYFGNMLEFPRDSYPIVWTVPSLVVVITMFSMGMYTTNRYSVSRSALSVFISYVIISASVFFAKGFAFSRAVVAIAGAISFLLLPGWRFILSTMSRSRGVEGNRKSLFGRRTLVVGTGETAQELVKKLRTRIDDGYDMVGFIDLERKRIGERVAGLEVLGSIDNVGKVISEQRVGEVIFSTEGLSYTDILSVIARSNDRTVNFRLVPNSREAIIGKTRIDDLETIPLVDIEYNIHKLSRRMAKRIFDITISLVLLLGLYPLVRLACALNAQASSGKLTRKMLLLPQVFLGRLSMVGLPCHDAVVEEMKDADYEHGAGIRQSFLGPKGLTGLVQINMRDDVESDEIERYKLYYAKNQSIILDLEILLKSLVLFMKKGRS